MENSGSLSPEDKRARKLRKKLRQIECLELSSRELNEEEAFKVENKGSIRKELLSLLKDIPPDEADLMKRQGHNVEDTVVRKKAKSSESEHEVQECPHTNYYPSLVEDIAAYEGREEPLVASKIKEPSGELPKVLPKSQKSASSNTKEYDKAPTVSKPVKTKAGSSKWKDSNYEVYSLEGHNDIILSVDCTDEYIISASRDTTAKVWRVGRTKEERSLRGHTSSVTAIAFLPEILASRVLKKFEGDPEAMPPVHRSKSRDCSTLAVSASLDCTLRVWDVQSGESFGSIYTYNGITAMQCSHWGAVTGTEGGKIEVWCIALGQRLAFVNAFQCQVTALHVKDDQIYIGSSEGDVGIWQFDPSTRSLSTLFIMESESQGYVPLHNLSALVGSKEILYFGDNGPNIKVLDWQRGHVSRFLNHIGDIGMTDSLAVSADGHLLSSSYFVDTGCSSVNVREMATGKYICSLIDKDEGRFLAMTSAPGMIVTGGHLLKVWIQREKGDSPKKSKSPQREIISPNVLRKLSGQAAESASEEDTDWASSDEDDTQPRSHISGNQFGNSQEAGSSWWCHIL